MGELARMGDAFELRGSNGNALRIEVLRYQFAAAVGDSLNWLVVRITATLAGEGSWTATDPSLETAELHELATWLEDVDVERVESRRLYFTEPNLGFSVSEGTTGAKNLRAHFAAESRPPWVTRFDESDANACIEFPLTELDLAAFAQWARRQRERFPPREREE